MKNCDTKKWPGKNSQMLDSKRTTFKKQKTFRQNFRNHKPTSTSSIVSFAPESYYGIQLFLLCPCTATLTGHLPSYLRSRPQKTV